MGGFPTAHVVTADQFRLATWRTADGAPVNNSVSFVGDPVLLLQLAANSVYHLEARPKYLTNTTANIKMSWGVPVGTTMDFVAQGQSTGGSFAQFNNTQSTIMGFGGFSSPLSVLMDGLVFVGDAPGNLQLFYSQFTANASDTKLVAGSYMQLTQVA